MSNKSISFTAIQAEVLEHRLSILVEPEMWEELLDDTREDLDPEELAAIAERLKRQLEAGDYTIQFDSVAVLEVLAEAIEGCTLDDLSDEGVDSGAITKQKSSALKRARKSAGDKLEELLGRPLKY